MGAVAAPGAKKKKHVDKKKARRYADQDEEDRAQAMIALGHSRAVVAVAEKQIGDF